MTLRYRADIDGLRAVAVIFVLLFHAFPRLAPGGFIGVDVFFVLSGYLISEIVMRGLDAKTFTFRDFYARRIRRIFPALLLVLAAVFVVGYLTLFPMELSRLGKQILAAAAFVSNFAFWKEAGYFDIKADAKPLLHLWSLGIEEQFYFFWPPILWFAWRRRWSFGLVAAAFGLASFAANAWAATDFPFADFYAPWNRAWELLLGGWIASPAGRALAQGAAARAGNWLAAGGALALAAGVALIDRDRVFPGAWALLPALGGALFIASGPTAWINRTLLASRPMVAIGRISYPLYLWHWPALSLVYIVGYRSAGARGLVLLASVALAVLTYRFVETPLRFGGAGRRKVAGLCFAIVVIGALGLWTLRSGFRGREDYSRHRFGAEFDLSTLHPCAADVERERGLDLCSLPPANAGAPVVFIGDSHAWRLFLAASHLDKSRPYAILGRTGGGNQLKSIRFEDLLATHRPLAVVFTYDLEGGDKLDVAARLAGVVQMGIPIILALDNPRLPVPPEDCDPRRFGPMRLDVQCEVARADVERKRASQRRAFSALQAAHPNQIQIYDSSDLLCGHERCSYAKDGIYLYGDEGHLSALGAELATAPLLSRLPAAR